MVVAAALQFAILGAATAYGNAQEPRSPGDMKRWLGSLDLLNCAYDPPVDFDPPKLLHSLYGRHFDPYGSSGSGGIVVLGAHNSGTSMVTRFIMLLGAFGGNYETISIHRHNRLKYYEQLSVSLFHDAFLGKFVDTRFRPYHGQNLDFSALTQADLDKLSCFAEKQMRDMNRHQPWVMKDPRMALAMPFWRPKLNDLVCVLVHKDPVKNSLSLAQNGKKSSHADDTDMMTAQRWLDLWGTTMLQALNGCKGAPTIIVDSRTITTDVENALRTLLSRLEHVGVRGLTMPDQDEIDSQIKVHILTGPREYRVSENAQKQFGLDAEPEVDSTPPVMSSELEALEESLRQYMVTIYDNPGAVRYEEVADNILALKDDLMQEKARREATSDPNQSYGLWHPGDR